MPRVERVELVAQLARLVEHEAVVAREPPGPACLAREARLLEERRARGDRRRGCVLAAHPEAVALAGVDRVLERELQRVVLRQHAVELGSRDRPARERRGGGGEEQRGQPLAPAARVDAGIREDQALARLRDGAVEEAPRFDQAVLRGGESAGSG